MKKHFNFIIRAVNLLLILAVLWQYQQVALVRADAVSARQKEIDEVNAWNTSVLQAQQAAEEAEAESGLKDGTYEGTALGFGDDITVQITISGGQMTDITVLQHDGEDKPYYTQALTMLDKMLTLKHRAWLRAAVQLMFFIAMPGAFVAGFNGVKQLFLRIGHGEVLQLDSFTLSLLGLCGFTILFGRFFCGYVCAFGSLGDGVWWLSGLVQKKLLHRKKQFQLPEKAVRRGQKVKYLVLAVIVGLCTAGVYSRLTGWSPWEVFSRLTALRTPPAGFGLGIALFVLILIGMAVQPRFFCQFLCPMGAVFALLPVLPFAQLHRDGENCIPGCSACAHRCPVDLKLDEQSLRSGECIACEACVGTCPKGNISRWDLALGKNFWLPMLAKAVLFFIMGVCLGFCRFF